MEKLEDRIAHYLKKRKKELTFRQLIPELSGIDFCSNDYLGFARSTELQANIERKLQTLPRQLGATGSRLISGNSEYTEYLEQKIADFHNSETGLLYNSGYDANVGFFSCVPRPGDIVIYDELIHASIHDGLKMNRLNKQAFAHNDTAELECLLAASEGIVFVAVESVYSMDGDEAPLLEIADLCEKYQAHLVVDEAHATGVLGEQGRGLVNELGLEGRCFARIHTFGKALGAHGAIILGNKQLRTYLVNFSRSFIYTTASPLHSLVAIDCAYDFLQKSQNKIDELQALIQYFRKTIRLELIESRSAIQCLMIPGNEKVRKYAKQLQIHNFNVLPIVYPTVQRGKERLRFCLHTFNTFKEIDRLGECID